VIEVFEEIKPDYVLNCAAFTAVDKAETESSGSYACE
jgi:dTDP-4-dehydrorhamnose reductase